MDNLLENWKKECNVLSSYLSLNKQLERCHVEAVYKILNDFFGVAFFERPVHGSTTKSNWIHYLLLSYDKPACIAAIYEIANLISYLIKLKKSVQKVIKKVFDDPRQLRDMFFEIYLYRLLDYNGIYNQKKIMEGNKELDLVCTMNGKEFLGECRKVYSPGVDVIDVKKYLTEAIIIQTKLLNRGFGLIGTFKLINSNENKLKDIFEKKLSKFVSGYNETTFQTVDYHDIDEYGEFSIIDYSIANNIEVESKAHQFHLIFKIIPPFSPIPNIANLYKVEVSARHWIPQSKIISKLFNVIKEKREQHKNSKYINKIYFFDSETIPDFELPLFYSDGMFEENSIIEFVDSLSENEIVCLIRREYTGDMPKVTIKALGNNINAIIKEKLENLKTTFDYKIEITERQKSTFNPFLGKT